MSEQKMSHTHGPWEVFDSHSGIYILDSAEQAAICKIEWCLEDEANARLIAAAPDLLQSLLGLIGTCEMQGVDYDQPDMQAARAAIDKAEGRVQR
jgi:hypothetical protein